MINAPKIYKIRIVFSVADVWDYKVVLAALRQIVKRSGLPYEPAKINSDWPRLTYGPVLGQGQSSQAEIADLYFSQPITQAQAQAQLKTSATDGLSILRVERIPLAFPSVSQLAEVMKYRAQGNFELYHPTCRVEEFFSREQLYTTIRTPNGITLQQDVKPFIVSVVQTKPDQIELLLQKHAERWKKPEEILAAWLQVPVEVANSSLPGIKFTREALYWRDSLQQLHAI